MKILLTGAGGMVGKNILEHSKAAKHEWLTPGRKELDLQDSRAVQAFFEKHRPDFVINCAGRVGGIQANMKNPVAFLVENVEINKNVMMAARAAGVKRLLNLGSSCMYPRNAPNPLDEDLVLKGELEPTNEGYAIAKVMAAKLCEYINREDSSFQYKTLIPCNLYGRHDKFEPEHSHLIPAIVHKTHLALQEGRDEIEIWGDGLARREFMTAADLADCVMECLERFDEVPQTMNVGLGYDYSVNEYYEAAANAVGFSGKFVHDLTKPTGMKQKLVSVARLEKFGWKAKTSLEEGLRQTYAFYLKGRV